MAHARTVLNILTTNAEARKLLLDIRYLAREMLANVIQHEADAIRPKPYEMAVIDEHGAGWDTQGRGNGDAAQRMRENEGRRRILMERRITSADVLGVGGAKKKARGVDIKR